MINYKRCAIKGGRSRPIILSLLLLIVISFTSCIYVYNYNIQGDYESINREYSNFYKINSNGFELEIAGWTFEHEIVALTIYLENIDNDSICIFPHQVRIYDDIDNYNLVSFYVNERFVNLKKSESVSCNLTKKRNKLKWKFSPNDNNHGIGPWFKVDLGKFLIIDDRDEFKFDILEFKFVPQNI